MKTMLNSVVLATTLAASAVLAEEEQGIAHRYPVVDGHIDVPYKLFHEWADVTGAVEGRDFDYPRAVAGGLNVPFMSIYTPAKSEAEGTSHQQAHLLIDSMEALAARAPDRFEIVTTPVSYTHLTLPTTSRV